MLGKKPTPVIGKLTNSFISGNRSGLMDAATSPRSPLEFFKIQSPRGLKSYDLGGVGLGIVAALEKTSGDDGSEIQANKALYNRNLNRSNPIPVNAFKTSTRRIGGFEEEEMDSEEDYTLVTCRRPGNKSFTRVYYDGGEDNSRRGNQRKELDWKSSKRNHHSSIFAISPARFGDFPACPSSDFLSSCHLCQKKLDGKDIYMYRGEKAFCSTECRYSQIVMDEKKEKYCSSEASRSAEVSSSSYKNNQIFSPGILAI